MTKRAALVLAGGKATRFQRPHQNWQDKALFLFEDNPLLIHTIENVSCAVDEIIVCVNDEDRKKSYFEILEKHKLRVSIVVDEKTEISGPNRAILTGLKATQAEQCLIIPCDTPFIKTKIVNYLFNISKNFDVTMPIWPNGDLEPLFTILKRPIGQEILQTLCQLKRSHVNDLPRAVAKTLLISPVKNIKNLDPQLKSFTNINHPKDIEKQQTHNIQGHIQKNIHLYQENISTTDLQLIREASKMCQKNDFEAAQEKFDTCKKRFASGNNFFWTALSCERQGEAVLNQYQLQKNGNIQTDLKLNFKSKELFLDAANNYEKETEIYKKKHCTRLLKRTIADINRCKTMTH